jgi:hypothetical protein
MEDYENALEDAVRAWQDSNHSNAKAAYRITKTYMALKQPESALQVLRTALTIPDLSEPEVTTLRELWQQVTDQQQQQLPDSSSSGELLTIKGVQRPISIREFIKEPNKQLGIGNFSEVIVVTHKVTREKFALKILEKKQAIDLAKRQHVRLRRRVHSFGAGLCLLWCHTNESWALYPVVNHVIFPLCLSPMCSTNLPWKNESYRNDYHPLILGSLPCTMHLPTTTISTISWTCMS